jgi:hypothetical protein
VLARQEYAAMVVGGPTTVLDIGGLRIVSDPTFDARPLTADHKRMVIIADLP